MREISPPDSATFDLSELWLSDLAAKGRSPRTIETYVDSLASLRGWRCADADLATLTKLEARAWVRHLQERYTPGGVAFRVRSVKGFFTFLVNEGEIESNPFKGLTVSVPAKPQTTADELEIQAMLLRAKSKPRDLALLTIMCETGCRKGEVAVLRMEDIDLRNRLITFPESKSTPRIVPMSDRCAVAIGRWLRRRGIGPGGLWGLCDPYTLVERTVRNYSKGHLGPHMLRRAFAVRWISRGGTESSLMRICGWSDSTMVRCYIAAHGDTLARDEFLRLMA